MASTPDLRRLEERAATTARFGMSRHRVLTAAAALAVAAVAAASLVLAQLAGWRTTENPATPAFLAAALGAPQADAPPVRKPGRDIEVSLRDGLAVRRAGAELRVEAEGVTGPWTRYADGLRRPAPFGEEVVIAKGPFAEQLLVVRERQGARSWRWRLHTTLDLESRDGQVLFLRDGVDVGYRIFPVRIYDEAGADVTPAGAGWSLDRSGRVPVLELELDDAGLPLPYVIDPPIAFVRELGTAQNKTSATSVTFNTTGAIVAGDSVFLAMATDNVTGGACFSATVGGTAVTPDSAVVNDPGAGNGARATLFSGHNFPAKAAGSAVTVSFFQSNCSTTASITAKAVTAFTYSGLRKTGARDQTNTGSADTGSGTAVTSSTLTTTWPDELIVGVVAVEGPSADTFTAGGSFTARTRTGTTGNPAKSNMSVRPQVRIVTATGGYTAPATITSRDWANAVATYKNALAANGSGTLAVSPTSVTAGTTGNTLTFTYTAATGGMEAGTLNLTFPAGWTAPNTTSGTAGYTTAAGGSGTNTISWNGGTRLLTVSGVTLTSGQTLTIAYGSGAGGGATAPSAAQSGTGTFSTTQFSGDSGSGSAAALATSPSVTVNNAADGSGTMTVSPATVTVADPATLTFTYTAAAGGTNGGSVTVLFPASWPAPNTTAGTAGYTTATGGSGTNTFNWNGGTRVLTISDVTLDAGSTLTVAYGTGAAGAVTVPAGTGAQTWTTQQRSQTTGTLTSLGTSPQTTKNNEPTATVSLSPASPTTNQTLTATATKNDLDGDTVTLTYIWKVNGVTQKTTSGSASLTDTLDLSLAGNGDEGQTVSVEVTPNDSTTDGTTVSDSELVANSAPTMSSVTIDQASPRTNDTLSVTVASADDDGDTRTYAYQWKRDGADIAGATTATLDLSAAGNGDKGDGISVEVTANDGSASSSPLTSATVAIANSAPVIDSVSIDQASPLTGDTLSLTITSHDDDGDVVTTSYAWTKNGVDIAGATSSTLNLATAGNGDKGDAIRARVTGSDGTVSSSPLTSSPVTVANTLPTATVSLAPASPTTDQTLTATATKNDTDAGDTVTLTYVWKVDGVTRKTTAVSASPTDTLDLSGAGDGDAGQTVSVEVTPNDGSGDGSTVGDSETVVNSAPTISSVTIDQAAPATNDTLTVSVVSADADGDTRTYTYQWQRNGADIAGATASTLDLSAAGHGDKGDDVSVRVTAFDGTASSAPSTSAAVTVANTAPTISSVTIDQGSPQTNDALTVTVVSADADGDPRTYAYQWAKGGVDRVGETGSGYDLSLIGNGDRGDAIAVRVTASDGSASSAPSTSGGVTVANTAPVLSSVTIDQASPQTNDTLTATVTATDADGDTVTPTRQWRRNGADLSGATGATLDLSQAGNGDRGDALALRVSVSDGAASDGPLTSAAVTVANTAPTITSASVDQTSPRTDDTVTVSLASADSDGDARIYAYQWRRNGVDIAGATDATLDLSQAGHGDEGDGISVRITASDGSASSPPTTTSAVTVANAAPAATASLAPASPTTGQTLTATTTRNDADGDTVTLTYVWRVNGVTRQTTAGSSSLTDTFDLATAGNGDKGQTVTVEVTPNDGTADGTAATDSETVANSAPTVSSVTIDQASPRTNDALSVTVVSADADGDARTYAYQWQRNGSDIAGATGATLDLSQAGNGSEGDTVAVRVVANDGSADSAPSTSGAVSVQNTAPTAAVSLFPAVVGTNDTLTATATKADADADTVTLTYVWKVNGVTRKTTAGSSSLTDAFDLSQTGNGGQGDTVSVEVTPNDGDVDGTAATDSVGIGNSLPTATVSLAPASPTTDQTLTATATRNDTDGDAVTLTYVWKVDGVTRKTTSASGSLTDTFDLSQAGNGGRDESVSVEVTPNDGTGDGTTATDSETVANSAPTAGVTLGPASPKTDQIVTATATPADADGDTVTLTYVWKVDGVTRKTTAGTSSLTDTFDLAQAGNGDKGQGVTVEVTPNDGTANGTAATDGATVANSAPVLSTVSVDQAAPTTNDSLTFSFTATDADGDALTPTRQWRRNGADLAGETGASLDLSQAGNGDRGDALAVRLSVFDGSASSGTLTSGAVTVANSAPTVVSVTIDQAAPRTNDALTVTVVSTDADGDARTYAHQWAANGVDRFGETASGYDLSLVGNGDRGDTVTVRVVASDGTAASAPVTSGGRTVANSAPVLASVAIDQGAPRTNDTLTATIVATDADGDAVTPTHQWRRNGTDLGAETGASLDLSGAGNGDKGDAIELRVGVGDGIDTDGPLTSATVTILNSAPTVASVAIDQVSPRTDDTLTVTVTSADDDGDARTYAYEWRLNGSTLAGETGATLDLSQPGNGAKGDGVSVRVTASDGTASSAPSTSLDETVENTAPTCSATTLSTTQDTPADAAPVCTDVDAADSLTPSVAAQGTRGVASILAGQLRYTPNAGEEGGDTFTYRASDGTDQSGAAAVAVTIQDVTPPQTTIDSGPAAGSTSASTGATLAFSSDDTPSTFECRLDGGAWTSCTSPHALSGLAEGPHTFDVRATDDGANTDPTPASRTWTVDSVAPETAISTAPADPTSDTTPDFAFTSEPGATFEARLDGGSWTPATSPLSLGPVAAGSHTFEVRATDAAGNTDATPASHTWTVDTTPPTTSIDAQPGDPDADRTPTFAFSSSEPSSTFECRVDTGSWQPCASPHTTAELGDGSRTFAVRATDAAGNTDPSPSSHTWLVDGGAPAVAITAPSGLVNGAAADPFTITATSPDADVTQVEFFECSAAGCSGGSETSIGVDSDGAPWQLSRAVPADGRWTVKAVATDGASNTGAAVVDVTVDRTAPTGGSISVAAGYDVDGSVAITTATGGDGGGSGVDVASATIEREDAPLADGSCGSFDGSWTPVSAPDATVASGGCYRYRLRVRDNAGNWATFTSAVEVKVDLTAPPAPTLTLANVSGTHVVGTTAYFRPGTTGSFTATPAAADPESGGITYNHPNLGTGWSRSGTTWSFTGAAGDPSEPNDVTATNAAGLTSAAASFTVTADAVAPVTTASAAPAANANGWNTSTPVSVTLAASDGGAGVKEIRYTTDGSVPGPTSPLYAAPVDIVSPGTTTLTFRAEDTVGNLEAPATLTVRIDTTAPTTPTLAYSGLANVSFDGTVVWFRPGAAGGFTVTPAASDPESGVAATAFPALGGGWTNTGGTYSFTAAATDPAEPNEVVATNGAGLASAGAPVTVTADSNAPVGAAACDAAVCSAGWYTTTPVTVVLTANDAQSGLDQIAWSTDGSAPTTEYLAPLSLSAEGTTTVRFASRDNVGNVETTVSQDVRIDTVAPTAAMGPVDPYLRGTVALTSTQSDATSGIAGIQFQVSPAGAGSWTNVPSAWDTTGTANGEYDVRVRATDAAGNATDSAPVASRWVDNLAPTIALDAPASPASGSVGLTSTAGDAHSGVESVEYEYSAAGTGDWETAALAGAAWDTTQLADGVYDLRARATDRSGNQSSWSVVNGILVDNDPPTVSVTAPAEGSFLNGAAADPFTVAATAADAGSGVASVEFLACTTSGPTCSSWTSIGTDATPAYTGAWTLPADGERRVKAVATDNAGHTSETAVTVTVDRTSPAASLTAPAAAANVRGTIPLAAAATDATSGVNSVDFQRSPAGASTWTTIGSDADGADGWTGSFDTSLGGAAGASDGLYDLRVFVTDGAGNAQTHLAASIRIDNTAPTGTLTDPGVYLSGSLALSGTAADSGSGVASVAFQRSPEGADTWTTVGTDTDGGDGWSATFDTTAGGTPDGRYDLRALVTDRAGNTHAHALPGRTIDNTKPTAAIADPGANLRLTVALGGTAVDVTAGVANVTFEYDNGGGWQLISTDTDGSNGWSASLNTTLPATPDGLYAFRLTATDRAGNQETSQLAGRRIDNTAPTASFADPGPYLMGAVQLAAAAGDGGSGIDAIRFERSPAGSGGPWTQVGSDATLTAGTWRTTWSTSPDGLYDLRVVVDDVAGNRTIDGVSSRRVDNTAPVTTDDAAPGRHNTDQTVTLSRSDAGSGPSATQYRVRPPGGSVGSWQSGTTVTILASSGDGVHAIEYFSTDAAGNVESVKSTDVLIDTTGPSGTVTDPSTFLRGLVTLTATADDPTDVSSVKFEYAPEGTAAWTQIGTDLTANGSDEYTVDWDTTTVADIAYDLQVTFLDSLGNPTVQSLTAKTVDNELPAIAPTAPAPGAVKRNVIAITANAADGVSGMREVRFEVKPAGAAGFSQVDVDNGSSPYSTSWDSTGSPDGPTDLRVIAVDLAGNLRSATTTIFVDNDAPTVTVSAPSTAVSGDVALTATGSSDVQSVTFTVDGSPLGTDGDGSDGFSVTWSTAGDGDQIVRAEATDVGGNVGTSPPVTVRVDNTNPTGSITTPNDGDTVGGPSIALAASASDPGSGVSATTFEFKRGSDSTWTPIPGSTWDTTALATGAYDLRARIADNAGNTATTAAITVTVDSSAPTIVLTTPGSSGISFSGVRTLAANVSGADAQRVVFGLAPAGTSSWTTLGTDTAGADGWTHVFATAGVADGVYDIRAEVVDSYGNVNASVRSSIRIDNTTPGIAGSTPADGSTVTASPASIDVTASEPLSAVTGVTLNGSPVGATVSGSTFSVVPGALASGPYTLAGTLVDASARTAAFRLHFTVLTGSPAALPYVERNAPAGVTTSLTAVDGASRVIVPAGAASGGSDWLVVRIQPLAASSVAPSPAGAPSSVVDVTARWALAGTEVHSFPVPLEIVLTGGSATTVPATLEAGGWRPIRPIPSGGTLPEGSQDGFLRSGDAVHILTRHLSLFALIRDLEPPSPPRAIGVVAGDGLTLRWIPGTDNSGSVGQVKLYVNGSGFAHYDPTQTEAKLGPWTAGDTRRFTFTQFDLAGNESAQTKALRGVPALVGSTLVQAQAALADRGFTVGTVTEKPAAATPGTVIEPTGLALAEEGAAVDLVVAAGGPVTPPQAKLVLGVVSPKTFSWSTRNYVGLRVKVSRASNVTATLIGPRGRRLYTWRLKVEAGASVVKLRMPRQVRRPGVYRIVLTATSRGQTTRRTIKLRIVGKNGALRVDRPAGPVEVAVAGDSRIRKGLALGLTGTNTRLISAAGDAAFEVAGSPGRDVRVVVVDVDRYGIRLVRDLKTVFPTVRLLALASRSADLRRAKAAGADVAMSRRTPRAKVARAIRALATSR